MNLKLDSDANDGLHFLCDRSLAPPNLERMAWDQKKPWKALVKSGALLSFQASGGGRCKAELFIDEDPTPELRKRGKKLARGALLRIPSGVLRFCGGTSWDQKLSTDGDPPDTVVEVPPGSYSVEALDTVYDGDDDSAMHREIERRMGTKAYRRHQLVGNVGCRTVVVAILCAAVGFPFVWEAWGWKGLLVFWGGALLLVLGVLKAFNLASGLPASREFNRHWQELHRQDAYPDFILVLRRLPEDADLSKMKGAALVGPEL
jgi:hypothetical protein